MNLTNFLSYGRAEADLSAVNLAAVVGQNGAGKSSLCTDALTWALFGDGRAASVDDYVRRGERECSVEVEFALGGATYRVIRTRGLQGAGKSDLQLARLDGGTWTPQTRDSIRETQAAIVDLLGMDYDIFVSTSMILQGGSDRFTAATPAERKAVLGSVLGLGIYDRLQEAAKARAKEYLAQADAAERDLGSIEMQLAERPALEERRAGIQRLMADQEAAVKAAEAAVEAATRKLASLDSVADRLNDLRRRIQALDAEAGLAHRHEAELQDRKVRALKILSGRAEILAKVEEEAAAKAEIEAWEVKAAQERDLSADLAAARNAEAAWKQKLSGDRARTKAELESAQASAALLGEVPCPPDQQELCRLLASARAAKDRVRLLRRRLAELDAAQPPEEAARIPELEAAIKAISYDPAAHQAVRNRLADLARWTRLKPELDQAEQTVAEAEREIQEIVSAAARRQRERDEIEATIRALDITQTQRGQAAAELEEARRRAAAAKDALSASQRELGQVEGRLEALTALESRKAGLQADQHRAEREAYLWGKLATAFGRNGVPALIIDSAIPQIESLANDLLGRMTAGRMSVALTTQRETKTSGVAETLDIIITDELGSRPYQMWSGAERFEVDISLRVAISKFLARRAGRRIECLIIDEGLGSLDPDARTRFLEAIRVIAADFAQVLVISHIVEISDAFPQRIEVAKGPGGSEVRVLA